MKALALAAMLATAAPAAAQTPPAAPVLKPAMAGLGFLVGDWSAGRGQVADTGGTSTGSSHIEAAAGGAVLLRRDQTQLFDKAGKPMGGFEQVMMVYADGGAIRAEYADGAHVIHYTSAVVEPGRSAVFTTAPGSGPGFRLAYTLTDPRTLRIEFAMAPPGGGAPQTIASGTLTRAAP